MNTPQHGQPNQPQHGYPFPQPGGYPPPQVHGQAPPQLNYGQPPAARPPQAKRKFWPHLVGYPVALIAGVAMGASGGGDTSTVTPASSAASDSSSAADAEQPAAKKAKPAAPAAAAASFGEGTYLVGEDIKPGTYRTKGSENALDLPCYWARLKSTSGGVSAIIANGTIKGPTTVTIKRSDKAFETSGCADWVKRG